MASTFTKRGGDPARSDEVEIDKFHSKIGQLGPLGVPPPVSAIGWNAIFRTEPEQQCVRGMVCPVKVWDR